MLSTIDNHTILTEKEAGTYLGREPRQVRQLIATHGLPTLFSTEELDTWLAGQYEPARSELLSRFSLEYLRRRIRFNRFVCR